MMGTHSAMQMQLKLSRGYLSVQFESCVWIGVGLRSLPINILQKVETASMGGVMPHCRRSTAH